MIPDILYQYTAGVVVLYCSFLLMKVLSISVAVLFVTLYHILVGLVIVGIKSCSRLYSREFCLLVFTFQEIHVVINPTVSF